MNVLPDKSSKRISKNKGIFAVMASLGTKIALMVTLLASSQVHSREISELGFTDLQFFGDTFIPKHVLTSTNSSPENPRLFNKIKPLLASAHYNITNLEGVVTRSFIPYELKSFSLRMPLAVIDLLSSAKIHGVNLANNHIMDYGEAGLFDTKRALTNARFFSFGAGNNITEALRPAVLSTRAGTACIIGYSKSLPMSFWAKRDRAGTASINFSLTAKHVKRISKLCRYTIVSIHWGAERETSPKAYQRKLARLVIDQGADAVIGHHPHVLQNIEVYKGRPIFYSIGNFAFGSRPAGETQSGMVVRFLLSKTTRKIKYELLALNVNNKLINYFPTFLTEEEADPLTNLLPAEQNCKKTGLVWSCSFH